MEREKVKARLIIWYSIFWILLFAALYLSYGVYFVDTTSTKSKWVILFSSSVMLLFGFCKFLEISYYKFKDDSIKKLINDNIKINNVYRRTKNFCAILFVVFFIFSVYKIISIPFTFCTACGILIYMISSKISAYSLINGKIKAEDSSLNSLNTSLKLSTNSQIIATLSHWSLFSIGIVILFHMFKDYEILIGYVCGYCIFSFFDNAISLVLKSAFKYIFDILNKFKKENTDFQIQQFKISFNPLQAKYTELFAISLICAIITGANILNLMGAFLPLIITANAMFANVLILLFSRINKTDNASINIFRKLFLSSIIISSMSIIEVYYWLGKDFLAIAYSIALGLAASIFAFYPVKNNQKKEPSLNNSIITTILNITIPIILCTTIFILSNGMEYVVFAFYNIAISILAYTINGFIISLFEKNKKVKQNINNYLKISHVLLIITVVLASLLLFSLESVDIANPVVLISILCGLLPVFFVLCTILFCIHNQKKIFIKAVRNNVSLSKKIFSGTLINALFFGTTLFLFEIIQYFICKYFDSEILFGFIFGVLISSMIILFVNNKTICRVSMLTIKIVSILFLGIYFLIFAI